MIYSISREESNFKVRDLIFIHKKPYDPKKFFIFLHSKIFTFNHSKKFTLESQISQKKVFLIRTLENLDLG